MKKIIFLLTIIFFYYSSNSQIFLIGWPNPNDTVHLKDTTVWNFNDIYIVNNGVLLIENSDFRNYGNIYLTNNGKLLVDSSYILNTSVMLWAGSDVTLQNSYTTIRIRATGTDSLNIKGLMDSTYHADWIAPFSDRNLHLINSTAWKYSIYAVDSSIIWIDSSRVSEICLSKNSFLNLTNSIHNGRAGCFWVWDNSVANVENSLIQVETVVRGTSKLSMYNSFIEDNPLWPSKIFIEDTGSVSLLNSRTPNPSNLKNNSILYYASIDSPAVAPIISSVPIYGSAYIETGPDNNATFQSYKLYYADSFYPDSIIQIGTEHTDSISNGILEYWNTSII